MPTRSSKLDLSQLAKRIVDAATGEALQPPKKVDGRKLGGIARARNQTKDERIDLARLAATARWQKDD